MTDVLRKIYVRMIALLNSYVEVEVTSTIPGVSAINLDVPRNQWRELPLRFFKYVVYWFLTCEAQLLDTGGMSAAST